MLLGDLRRGCAFIRETARHKLIKCCSQTVNVTAHIHRRAGEVLRTDILGGSHHFVVVVAFVSFAGNAGKPQVGQFGAPVFGQHDVVRLDVAVNQFLFFPGAVQRLGNLLNNRDGFINGEHFLAFQHRFHGFAVNIFHGKIEDAFVFADGISLNDMRVIKFGRGTRFLDEVDYKLRVVGIIFLKYFHRCRAVQ